MKLKLVFCLGFILLFSVNSSTQNYISYHKKVNEAKILLSETKFASALEIYKTVFVNYPKRFYRDLHNACVCAIYCDKMEDALHLAKDLILHGYQLEDFKTATFKKFRTTEQWKEIERDYPELRKQYEDGFDTYLDKKYFDMCKADQSIAMTAPMGDLRNDKARIEISTLLKMDYETNGIPNFVRYKDSRYLRYFILYRHYFGTRNYRLKYSEEKDKDIIFRKLDGLKIKKILLKEIHNGNVAPRFLVDAITYNLNPYGKETVLKIDFEKEEVFFDVETKDFEQLEKDRKEIGLLPLDKESAIAISGTWRKDYPFRNIKESLDTLTEKSFKNVMKHVKKFEKEVYSKYSNTIQTDFFLDSYARQKKISYIGLEKYVVEIK